MKSDTTKLDPAQPATEMAVDLFDNWFDPIETEVRARAREFIEDLIRGELDTVLARPRYGRSRMAGDEERADVTGHRHGSRTRSLTGTFGPIEIALPATRCTPPVVEQLNDVLRTHPGVTEVRLLLKTRGSTKVLRLDDRLRVTSSPALIADLKQLLGPGCVA